MSGHEQKNYSMFSIASNLTMACLVSGAIIALVYYFTAPIAVSKAAMLKTQSMQALVKDADKFEAVSGKTEWFAAKQGTKTIAYVVPAESKGYGGAIKLLVAVTPDGKVIRYDILSHNETPGLGDGATKDSFKNQFLNKTAETLTVVKDPSNKENIQAMTGATITSKAVTKAVKEAVGEVTAYAGGGK